MSWRSDNNGAWIEDEDGEVIFVPHQPDADADDDGDDEDES